MRKHSQRGSSIVAVLVSLVLVSASLGVYINTQAQLAESRRFVYEDASAQSNTTIYNGWAARGLDPVALQTANSALVPPSSQRKASSLSATTLTSPDRAAAVGALRLSTTGATAVSNLDNLSQADRAAYLQDLQGNLQRRSLGGFTVGISQGAPGGLPPPEPILTSLAAGSSYSGAQLVAADPDSPQGVIVRYTVDGSIPNESSPVWDPAALWSEASIPLSANFRAFHPDTLVWNPSISRTVNFTITAGLIITRLTTGVAAADEFFTIEDVLSGSDGLALAPVGPASAVVYYTLDGSDPRVSGTRFSYATPILPWLESFPIDGVPVIAYVDSGDPRYEDSDPVSVRMRPDPVPLPGADIAGLAPRLSPGSPLSAAVPPAWAAQSGFLVPGLAAAPSGGAFGNFLPSITINF